MSIEQRYSIYLRLIVFFEKINHIFIFIIYFKFKYFY